jgi:hypothetical protein
MVGSVGFIMHDFVNARVRHFFPWLEFFANTCHFLFRYFLFW